MKFKDTMKRQIRICFPSTISLIFSEWNAISMELNRLTWPTFLPWDELRQCDLGCSVVTRWTDAFLEGSMCTNNETLVMHLLFCTLYNSASQILQDTHRMASHYLPCKFSYIWYRNGHKLLLPCKHRDTLWGRRFAAWPSVCCHWSESVWRLLQLSLVGEEWRIDGRLWSWYGPLPKTSPSPYKPAWPGSNSAVHASATWNDSWEGERQEIKRKRLWGTWGNQWIAGKKRKKKKSLMFSNKNTTRQNINTNKPGTVSVKAFSPLFEPKGRPRDRFATCLIYIHITVTESLQKTDLAYRSLNEVDLHLQLHTPRHSSLIRVDVINSSSYPWALWRTGICYQENVPLHKVSSVVVPLLTLLHEQIFFYLSGPEQVWQMFCTWRHCHLTYMSSSLNIPHGSREHWLHL